MRDASFYRRIHENGLNGLLRPVLMKVFLLKPQHIQINLMRWSENLKKKQRIAQATNC